MIEFRSALPLMRATVLLTAALLPGCGRPTGDFGRVKPSALHDDVLPSLGRLAAENRGEPVSRFNLTSPEQELRDRSFAFLRAPHLGDWWRDRLIEGQRTKLLPAVDPNFDPARYFDFLRADPYRAAEARWNKVIADLQGDAMLLPSFCAIAARVRKADAERLAAVSRKSAVDAPFIQDAYDRVAENNEVMALVGQALDARLSSYRFAIDRLEVETPSENLWAANRAYNALAGRRCPGSST